MPSRSASAVVFAVHEGGLASGDGGCLSRAKRISQRERLAKLSGLLNGPSGDDPATIHFVALALWNLAELGSNLQEFPVNILLPFR